MRRGRGGDGEQCGFALRRRTTARGGNARRVRVPVPVVVVVVVVVNVVVVAARGIEIYAREIETHPLRLGGSVLRDEALAPRRLQRPGEPLVVVQRGVVRAREGVVRAEGRGRREVVRA